MSEERTCRLCFALPPCQTLHAACCPHTWLGPSHPPAHPPTCLTHVLTTTTLGNSEDEAYAKAYFRRAVLHGCLGEYDAAAADLAACAQLDPSAAGECEREAARMERRAAAQEARQRSAMKGFLDRT